MANDVGVRSFLAGKGVDSSSIGYDQNSGNVTVNGQNFIKPSLNMAGTTYDNQQNLDSAYGNYQKQQQPSTGLASTAQNSAGVAAGSGQGNEQWVTNGNNQQQGNTQKGNTFHASGNDQAAQQSQGNNLQSLTSQYTNQQPYTNPYAQQISDIMNQVNAARQATTAPVDPYSSPQYAAQQAQQQKLALQGTRAAQESMGQSGFARSTNLADRAQHIQNDANDYMTTQAVPQIIAQIQAQHQQAYQNSLSSFAPLMQLSQQADTLHQQQQAQLADQVKFLTGQANADRTYDAGRTDAANTNAINQGTLTGNYTSPEMAALQKQFDTNSAAYATATPEQQAQLHEQNLAIGQQLGKTYDPNTGEYSGGNSTRTIAGQTMDLNKMKDIATLSGMMPDGKGGMMKTSAQQQEDLKNEWLAAEQLGKITPALSQLYGIPEGTPTEKAKEFAATLAVQNRQADASMVSANASASNAATNAANSARANDAQTINQKFEEWKLSGKAPDGIPGVDKDTPFYDKTAAQKAISDAYKTFNETGVAPTGLESVGIQPGTPKYNPTATNRQNLSSAESTFASNIDKVPAANQKAFFNANRAAIIAKIGSTGYDKLYGVYFDQFGNPK